VSGQQTTGGAKAPKPQRPRRPKPGRVPAVAEPSFKEEGPEQSVDDGLRHPARLIARLAEWTAAQDIDALRAAFRRVGLDLNPRLSDHHYIHKYFGHNAQKLRTGLDDEAFMELAGEVRAAKRTLLYYNRLYTLYQAVQTIGVRFPDGPVRILEAGVFRGGSTYFLGRVAEREVGDRVGIVAVDTFKGHAAEDIPDGQEGTHAAGTFRDVKVDDVQEYLRPFPFVEVVQGRVQDVAPSLEGELHLIHSDLDLRAPTRFVLDLAAERLATGGIAIVDDYGFSTCPGVKEAVDEFRESEAQRFFVHILDSGQALVVKTS